MKFDGKPRTIKSLKVDFFINYFQQRWIRHRLPSKIAPNVWMITLCLLVVTFIIYLLMQIFYRSVNRGFAVLSLGNLGCQECWVVENMGEGEEFGEREREQCVFALNERFGYKNRWINRGESIVASLSPFRRINWRV